MTLASEMLGGSVSGKRVAVLGLAFKPNSDDVRDSPALDIAGRLLELGATVAAYDPEAIVTARRVHPELDYAASAAEAVAPRRVVAGARGAHALFLPTATRYSFSKRASSALPRFHSAQNSLRVRSNSSARPSFSAFARAAIVGP